MENTIMNESATDILGKDNTDDSLANLLEEMNESVNNEETTKTEAPTNTTTSEPVKNESPLEQLKNQQKSGNTTGMIVTDEELEAGKNGPVRNIVYNDTRTEAWSQAITDLEETKKKRDCVKIIKRPMKQNDYIQMMLEIDSIQFDENGNPYFNYTPEDGRSATPEFCVIRKPDEEPFDFSELDKNYGEKKVKEQGESGEESDDEPELDEESKHAVQVIIDKTGLGSDFMFSEEERKKLTEAESIVVREVKLIDIAAIREKRSNRTFQETINEYDISGSKTTICFPASGFKAQMKGLTYGEYSDIQLSMDTVTFDQYRKRLSIIYNKMTNISTGQFKSFEDFLKNMAYTDIQLALYGLYISTEAESQEIQLRCGVESCGKSFNWKYNTRSVLKLNRCAPTFLKKMEQLASADAADYDKIKADSAVMNSKYIELPESKFVVELGIASAYDFLYNFIPLMDEGTFKEAFGEDLNQVYMNNILLLTSVRSVYVPNEDGTYTECTGYKDILDAIYNVTPTEVKILATYTAELQSDYDVVFSFGDVTCPHCNHVTKNMDMSMDDLVFQTYQRLMNTEIDLTKIQNL